MAKVLNSIGSKKVRALAGGLFLAFVGAMLVASFQFISDHRWFWDIAPLVSTLAVITAAVGGSLVGYSLVGAQQRRLWLVQLGVILGVAWIASGTAAAALGFLGMNHLPAGYIGWDSYHGTWFVGRVTISLLQFATVAGLTAGFSIWFGLAPRAHWGLAHLHISAGPRADD
jgi:hypothetical protein